MSDSPLLESNKINKPSCVQRLCTHHVQRFKTLGSHSKPQQQRHSIATFVHEDWRSRQGDGRQMINSRMLTECRPNVAVVSRGLQHLSSARCTRFIITTLES